jgi:hypothetical protein
MKKQSIDSQLYYLRNFQVKWLHGALAHVIEVRCIFTVYFIVVLGLSLTALLWGPPYVHCTCFAAFFSVLYFALVRVMLIHYVRRLHLLMERVDVYAGY